MYLQLIINPGSTSTKLALYRGEEKLVQEDVTHDSGELAKYKDNLCAPLSHYEKCRPFY